MTPEPVNLHRIWSETDTRLDVLRARAREGVEVLSASDFGRWLQFSGILELLEQYQQDVPLPVHGRQLRVKCAALVSQCGEWFRLHDRSFKEADLELPRSALEQINERAPPHWSRGLHLSGSWVAMRLILRGWLLICGSFLGVFRDRGSHIVRETVICFEGNCWLHTVIDGVAQTTWIGRKGRGDVWRYARAQHLELIDLDSARDGSVPAPSAGA